MIVFGLDGDYLDWPIIRCHLMNFSLFRNNRMKFLKTTIFALLS